VFVVAHSLGTLQFGAMTPFSCRMFVLLLVVQNLTLLEGKLHKGKIKLANSADDTENWKFLTKFGYGLGESNYWIRYKLSGDKSPPDQSMQFNIFLDEDWQTVQEIPSCSERNSKARKTWSDSSEDFPDRGTWSEWKDGTINQNIRPHIWYFVASQCNENQIMAPLHLEYEIHMTQHDGSEFSVEMQGMMTLNCLVLVCLLAFIARYCARCISFASSTGKLHPVIWALSVAIALQFIAQLLHTVHLWVYSSNGRGLSLADLLSEVLLMLSQVVQTTLLIAIAMGYTLLPSRNGCLAIVKWIALLSLVIHTTLVSFGKTQDESACKYHENEGAIGWVLLSVRLFLFVWFHFATQASQKEGGLRLRDFLKRFQLIGSIYFLAYPVLFLIVQLFAAYLRHPILQLGLLAMQATSISVLSELFLTRGTYFKVSALSSSLLPGCCGVGAFDKQS
jgi:hypothetical protein